MRTEFDKDYYERFYENRNTRVAEPSYFKKLARFIAAYTDFIDIRVRSIVDLGCGTGALKQPLEHYFPKAQYSGVDISPFACEKFGWEQASVEDYAAPPCDLVICHDVFQYLNGKQSKAAFKNLSRLCQGALHFSVLTQEDWQENCDKSRTDAEAYLRPAAWYQERLARHFRNLGGGVYLSRKSDIALYALEHLD